MTTSTDAAVVVLPDLYRRMVLIREFEGMVADLYRSTEIPGFVHLSVGQEATAVGVCQALRPGDTIVSTHRGHGHCLAKGLDPFEMFAELLGRESGSCRGRGGSMHIADPEHGIFGANGIVAAGLPIAVGAAAASDLSHDGSIVVAFFGDGAVAQGAFHEAVNLAAVWRLPIAFVCENNHYAEFAPSSEQHVVTLQDRAQGVGLSYEYVDGNDVLAVHELMSQVAERLRAGAGPVLVECDTYRWRGHYEGDPEHYRTQHELESWKQRDPIATARSRLDDAFGSAFAGQIKESVSLELSEALARARSAPSPSPAMLLDHVVAPRPAGPEQVWQPAGEFKTMHAVREALRTEMLRDDRVVVAGIDVAKGGNVFGLFRGLVDEFPGRVRDTPISESAIVGFAIGAAMAGYRPVVEIMYMDFLGVCFDQIMNQAAKLRFMTGGKASLPLVIRTQFGAGRSSGSQHSQSLEALLAHIPGLTVVMPSTPADTYGLLRAAIQDPNPVIFVENRLQYGQKGPRPPVDFVAEIGKARVVREGADATLVSYSRMLQESLAAADDAAREGIDVEVVDLRTIVPLDWETVHESLRKTSRLVIAHEAVRDFGVGAELAARAVDEGFWSLDAPVLRVAPPPTPAPYAPSLESHWLPGRSAIADALRAVVAS